MMYISTMGISMLDRDADRAAIHYDLLLFVNLADKNEEEGGSGQFQIEPTTVTDRLFMGLPTRRPEVSQFIQSLFFNRDGHSSVQDTRSGVCCSAKTF
jgi:hypothetical protein